MSANGTLATPEMIVIDPSRTMTPAPLARNPLKSLVVPRPIGWISTVGRSGVVNLAPFSFFNLLSQDPPFVMYCANGTHIEGGAKDSLLNVQDTGEFVFNLVSCELAEAMNVTSAAVPRAVDEMRLAGLTAAPSLKVRPPRVKEAPAAFECTYLQTIDLPLRNKALAGHVVIGEVIAIHLRRDVLTDGLVDIRKLRPVARLGYMDYAVIEESFAMERPK